MLPGDADGPFAEEVVMKRWSFAALAAACVAAGAPGARAGSFSATVRGELVNTFSPANCGDQLGDTYDTFCPSGQCRCEQYEGTVSGNRVGAGSDVSLHLTIDQGDHTSSPGCSPVFGELTFTGSKDAETIHLNGSLCEPFGSQSSPKAKQLLRGGFGVASSSHGVAAFGTLSGTFEFNAIGYKLKLSGRTP
jgi:hypothetical protein